MPHLGPENNLPDPHEVAGACAMASKQEASLLPKSARGPDEAGQVLVITRYHDSSSFPIKPAVGSDILAIAYLSGCIGGITGRLQIRLSERGQELAQRLWRILR